MRLGCSCFFRISLQVDIFCNRTNKEKCIKRRVNKAVEPQHKFYQRDENYHDDPAFSR